MMLLLRSVWASNWKTVDGTAHIEHVRGCTTVLEYTEGRFVLEALSQADFGVSVIDQERII